MEGDEESGEITRWLVSTALHDDRLLQVKGSLTQVLKNNKDLAALVAGGCDGEMLANTLAFAVQITTCYPKIVSADLKDLAKDVKSVLRRMKELTPSVALPIGEDVGEGKYVVKHLFTGGDLHVWPWLEEDLLRKSGMYEDLARLSRDKKIPTQATLRRFAFVWPVHYVYSRLKKERYAAISRLLTLAGIEKEPRQLKQALKAARREHPEALLWMDAATPFLQEVTAYLNLKK